MHAEKIIYNQFKLKQNNIENPNIYWHNAGNLRFFKVMPRYACHVKINCIDEKSDRRTLLLY